jgi:integrase/recombinase XerD
VTVNTLVTKYVTFCRTLGERCGTKAVILQGFCRAIGPRTRITRIRVKEVTAFLAGTGPLTNAWHDRYSALKGLFGFAVSHGELTKAPLPAVIPKRPARLAPYIYSREEIHRLLDTIPAAQHYHNLLEPATLRAILLSLYAAGLRRGEAERLTVADVDLANALLTIRDTKFFKSRLVPIGPDLTRVLSEYARWRATNHRLTDAADPFFVNRRGKAVHRCSLHNAFKRLREHAGVRRPAGSRLQPRMHDLRHTFAVHRLTEWYRQGADVQRLVYHLSVYLGHAHLADTQVYLTMTPELLEQAGGRFQQYARGQDNHA